jgi:AcrR family transcriptional regulator
MTTTGKLSGQERREAIVQTAIKLFSDKGFRGTTTRELAAAVGVSEPVLYQHFATKRDLYTAIIESRAASMQEITTGLESLLARDDDRAFFMHIANGIMDWYEQDPVYARLLIFSALERHELAQLFFEAHSRCGIELITKYMKRRIEQGRFRDIDPALIGHAFIGMAGNYAMDRTVFQHMSLPLDRATVVEGMVSIFLEGIQK